MKKLSFVLLSVLAFLSACSGSGDKKAKNEIMVKTITVTTESYKSNNNYLADILTMLILQQRLNISRHKMLTIGWKGYIRQRVFLK